MFKASAPGSLMLLGEYAVLYGYPALVCAVDKRMVVTLTPRKDKIFHMQSYLGSLQMDLAHLQVVKPFEFVLTILKKYQSHFKQGCDITIASEFLSTIGLASSAAVTVATLSVVLAWLEIDCSQQDLLQYAREIIQEVQGMGSGADVAACIYGGIIAYDPKNLWVDKLSDTYALTVIYSGTKTPTVESVNRVKQAFHNTPDIFSGILSDIGTIAHLGVQAVRDKDWRKLGKLMTEQQEHMEKLGVNTIALQHIIDTLCDYDGILGAKISGSGFGDCVVGLGAVDSGLTVQPNFIPIPVAITMQGVTVD